MVLEYSILEILIIKSKKKKSKLVVGNKYVETNAALCWMFKKLQYI